INQKQLLQELLDIVINYVISYRYSCTHDKYFMNIFMNALEKIMPSDDSLIKLIRGRFEDCIRVVAFVNPYYKGFSRLVVESMINSIDQHMSTDMIKIILMNEQHIPKNSLSKLFTIYDKDAYTLIINYFDKCQYEFIQTHLYDALNYMPISIELVN